MNLLCKLFGHQPPGIAGFGAGASYARIGTFHMDGIKRLHAALRGNCPRCNQEYLVCMTHVPGEIKIASVQK